MTKTLVKAAPYRADTKATFPLFVTAVQAAWSAFKKTPAYYTTRQYAQARRARHRETEAAATNSARRKKKAAITKAVMAKKKKPKFKTLAAIGLGEDDEEEEGETPSDTAADQPMSRPNRCLLNAIEGGFNGQRQDMDKVLLQINSIEGTTNQLNDAQARLASTVDDNDA